MGPGEEAQVWLNVKALRRRRREVGEQWNVQRKLFLRVSEMPRLMQSETWEDLGVDLEHNPLKRTFVWLHTFRFPSFI